MTGEERAQQGVRSVETGLALVAALGAADTGLGLGCLARRAGMAPAKAHRYLVSLVRAGLVEQHPETGHYDLGPLALELGMAALRRLDIVRLADATLHRLRDDLDETVLFAVWGNRGPTVVRWLESSEAVTVNVRLGSVMPLCRSATGRAFLAWGARRVIEPLLDAELAAADDPEVERGRMEALAAQTRSDGVSTVAGDLLPGVAAVAAPVFDHQDEVAGVVTALGYAGGFDADPAGDTARTVRAAADDLSRRLGHRGAGGDG
ncbi:HTH-type transcriptional regulator KipR [wastewater metagenome]|uniref:HTH-type transcriptional regulator KipR n=2 Tax=unclassified sequences TaxID=12908 RepID=A0A5B8RAU6_9ZZZZ|nr:MULTISPECIES: IclR family transcriptional regulator [Arhodomonas]MCS4502730.1 IclR family transcriptional regulator [Arhodomonas aquaeolei]QEA03787.1 HTH-type transcriptional regulator KipR [uncultured organism]